jgi:hypothetical protein
MGSYSTWCQRLTNYFFSIEKANKRVRLMLDAHVLDSEFSDLGGEKAYLKAMKTGPEWMASGEADLGDICRNLEYQWHNPPSRPQGYPEVARNAPPFLPYLCLFAYAWTIECDVHANDFHNRLEELYPHHGLQKNQTMKWCTEHLWRGLADWSYGYRDEFGFFKIERLGQMAHVGISRAQTLFRPRELKLLPEIFSACGLQPEDSDDLNNIHEALAMSEHSWHYKLPNVLVSLILDWDTTGNPMAEAVFQILSEELSEWDGEVDKHSKRYIPSIKIFRSILADKDTLKIDLCVTEENVVKLANLELKTEEEAVGQFSTEGSLIAILKQDSNSWDPCFVGSPKTGGAHSEDDDFGNEDHICKWIPRSVSLFQQKLPNGRLIETDIPPRSGNCICLVSEVGKKRFDSWRKDHESLVTKLEIPCPSEWEIYRLSEIESLDMDSFPLDRRASSEASIIKLTAGTKIAPDKYMDYDLPIVSSTASGITLDCAGAELKEIKDSATQSRAWGIPEYRQYELTDYDGGGTILISAQQGQENQEVRTLGVIESSKLPGNLRRHDAAFSVDKFGWPGEKGLRGSILHADSVPTDGSEHEYYELPDDFFANRTDPRKIPGAQFQFSEVLGLKGKYSYSELKGRMISLCNVGEGDFFRALRFMRDLGDIDTCMEDNGIISHIYPNQAELVVMPWKKDGQYVAALRGAYTLTAFKSYLDGAEQRGIETLSLVESNDLANILPPTTYFKFDTLNELASLSEACRLKCDPASPAARRLAEWSGNSDEWFSMLESSETTSGAGKIEKYYDTNKFAFRNRTYEDERHRYELFLISRRVGQFRAPPVVNMRKSNPNTDGTWETLLDANIREAAWPKWYLQSILTGPNHGEMTYRQDRNGEPEEVDRLPIFYQDNDILLPRELSLPYVLSRALTLCSAIPPTRIPAESTAYNDIAGNFTGKDSGNGYKGELWLYRGVSYELAELILAKVEAFPAYRQQLGFRTENEEFYSM